MTRRPLAALLLTAMAVAAARYLTPPPGSDAAASVAGWPRLALYALAGAALAGSVPAERPRPARPTHTGEQGIPWLVALRTAVLMFTVPARPARLASWWSKTGLLRSEPGAYLLVALGAGASLVVAGVEVERLSRAMDDPLGPPLWGLSMLLSVGYTVLPRVRRLGWSPLWPCPGEEPVAAGGWQWLRPALVVGVLLIAATLRLPALGNIPLGINADEGDRAASALDVLNGQASGGWFGSGWFYINMVYFRLLAASMLVFGADTAGGRTLNALVGIGFVAAVTWLGCRTFGWRVGLLAAALAAGMGVTLQHSRFIAETGPTMLLWALSIGGFLEGARSGRPWAWAVAGLSGGLSLYFYPSARLWVVGAALTVVVIWLHQREPRLWLGCGVAVVAALVAAAPYLVHLSMRPDEITLRYRQTTVLDPANQSRLAYLTPPEPPLELAGLQVERTLGMFDRYPDAGGFMPTGRPLFSTPLAALTLVGAAYALVRSFGDPRLAVVSVWFWLGLSGVAITVETPDYLRAVGMVPAVCFVVAVPMLDLIDRALDVGAHVRPSTRRLLAVGAPAVLGLSLVAPEVVSYFDTFRTIPPEWGAPTREGQLVAALGQLGPVYSLEMDEHLVSSGWVRLLAPDAQRGRVPNPGRELPALAPVGPPPGGVNPRPDMVAGDGQGLSIVLAADANQDAYVNLLRLLYPLGAVGDGSDGRRIFEVSASALATSRGVTLVTQAGSTRHVDAFGRIPADVRVPGQLTWRAGVRLARPGAYRLTVDAPAQLRLDGLPVLDASAAATAPLVRDVLVAPGLHFLELVANVDDATQRVGLTIGDPAAPVTQSELSPSQTYSQMDAPWGLLGRVARRSLAGRSLPEPADAFVDATIAMAFFEPELGFVSAPNAITWSGTLLVPYPGTYRMAFAAEDRMRLELDGRPANVVSVGPTDWAAVGLGSAVQLTAGPHRVRVTLDITHGGREVARWNWVPPTPGGALDAMTDWTVVPPQVLRPDLPAALVAP